MFKFHVTEIRSIQISLAIIFITLGIIVAIINFNFQIATDQRVQTLRLTQAIHDSDAKNDNETQQLIDLTLGKVNDTIAIQKNNTKAVTDILLENQRIIKSNQELIKNTTGLNLNQTFSNRNMIHKLADQINSFNLTEVKKTQEHDSRTMDLIQQDLAKLLNSTRR